MKKILIYIVKLYKKLLSPILYILFGSACRFTPTCSEYFIEAVNKKGIVRGTFMGVKRVLRCNPLSKPGFDPVT